MELNQIRYALRVADRKNFSKAAQDLSIAQPTLTQQIGKLEAELGVLLFNRTTRSVSLTDAGVDFVTYASRVLADMEDLGSVMHKYTERVFGILHIGIMPNITLFNLPFYLSKYAMRNKDITINIIQASSKELASELLDNKLDIAFIDEQELDESTCVALNIRPLRKEHLLLAMPRDAVSPKDEKISLSELEGAALLRYRNFETVEDNVRRALTSASVSCRLSEEYYSLESLYDAITEGKGIAFVPESFKLRNYNSVCFAQCSPSLYCSLSAATLKKHTETDAEGMLIEYIMARISHEEEDKP